MSRKFLDRQFLDRQFLDRQFLDRHFLDRHFLDRQFLDRHFRDPISVLDCWPTVLQLFYLVVRAFSQSLPVMGELVEVVRVDFHSVETRSSKGTFLRRNTPFELSTMKIGSAVRAVREPEKIGKKIKIKKQGHQRYISRVRGSRTPAGSVMKLNTLVELPNTINPVKLYCYRLHSF